MRSAFIAATLAAISQAQQVGHQKQEYHPPLGLEMCTANEGCQTQQKSITVDANWRWTHKVNDWHNCYTGTQWDTSVCTDPDACAKNCAIDGIDTNDMRNIYGISSDGTDLRLNFKTGSNVGSRTYMMQDDSNYEMFKLKGKEFSFEVDVSQLPCGVNGALYFVEMPQDGDMGVGNNNAGAKYGTGYCDAQCPHDIKFIKGQANIEDWNSTTAMGKNGICCQELDIWEANSISSAYTLHPCTVEESTVCSDDVTCGDGDNRYNGNCDKDGCDLNPFRAGVQDFYGPGKTVDTTQPFTVITQFITDDGSEEGDIQEVKRFFVQNGQRIAHPMSNLQGMSEQYDSITNDMCSNMKQVYGDQNDYKAKGGMKVMSDSIGRGMVLVMSLWDDHAANMQWLDGQDPHGSTAPGAMRGTCDPNGGDPDTVEREHPNAYVKYGKIRVGEIDSYFAENNIVEFLQ